MSKQVSIVQINDTHANLFPHGDVRYTKDGFQVETVGGYARIQTKIDEFRSRYPQEVLVFDNGDTLHGTYETIETKGEVMVPYLRKLGINAMTFHWDSAYTIKHLKTFEEKLGYPILAANVYQEGTKDLIFPPRKTFVVNGLTIGVIGIASNIIRSNMPKTFWEGADFTDGMEEASMHAKALKHEGADLIILLSHLGYPQDIELLKGVSGIDLCLSGHTHNRVRKPQKIGSALIIQSGALASSIGFIRLTIDQKKITAIEHEYIVLDDQVEDAPDMVELFEKDETLLSCKPFLDETVGETTLDLHRGSSFYGTMDYLLLDAMRDATGTAISFSNGWRYGGAIKKGKISRRDLYYIVPMNPEIRKAKLTGQEIHDLLEDNLERTFSASPFKQMGGYIKRNSGLKIYFKLENPYGQRIQRIFTETGEIDCDQLYEVAYVTIQAVPEKIGRDHQDTGIKVIEAMEKYLAKGCYSRDDLESYIPV